jgi:transposase
MMLGLEVSMESAELVVMSMAELNRLEVIKKVIERRMTQRLASEALGLGIRQVQRLVVAYKNQGPAGLASGKRGRPSNRRYTDEFRSKVLSIVREKYWDFGPTLAREKLLELHDISIGLETLRLWMIDDKIWITRQAQKRRPHQPRHRRECFGELVQIDGSPHDWFESRGPKCTLLVFIDDATGKLMELRFVETESAFDYFDATRSYIERHGKPIAFYSDKNSIFRVVKCESNSGVTQFGRALAALNIDIICANTPQAKGRVERVNRTLQDRLVKELRLAGINSMEDANHFAPHFMQEFNRRFARVPKNQHNAHRVLMNHENLDMIFAWQEKRKLTRNLVLHYKNKRYLIEPTMESRAFAGKQCIVYEWENGRVEIECQGTSLPYTVLDKNPRVQPGAIVENKRLGAVLSLIKDQQDNRDHKRLKSKKITLRQKKRIEEQMAAI